VGGEIFFQGEDLLKKTENEMRRIRGSKITIILQDPLTSLNPVFSIGNQVAEPFKYHTEVRGRKNVIERVVNVLTCVGIPSPKSRLKDFPHQFSGGMRQRVVAGMSIACQPQLLIADEPTTALDVTIQAQFLRLIKTLQKEQNLAVIFISHDLGIVAEICDRVLVMYAGRIIESGDVFRIFENPAHPYTEGLMKSVPLLGSKVDTLFSINGQPPDLRHLPQGCRFSPRCTKAMEVCHREYPPKTSLASGGFVNCWLWDEHYHD
jgi:oligopeptide/dipeptide ABC transporter ATP-binding protein